MQFIPLDNAVHIDDKAANEGNEFGEECILVQVWFVTSATPSE